MKVMKFGGSVLHHEAGFQAMVDIIGKQQDKHILVISAFSDITRKLDRMMHITLNASYEDGILLLNDIMQYHEMLSSLLLPHQERFHIVLERVSLQLQRLLKGISLTKELSPRIHDVILSQGEVLATHFISELLDTHGIHARLIDAGDIIISNDDYGSAKPIEHMISHNVNTVLIPELQTHDHIIIAGFIGKNIHGDCTTMGYESSNLTAALLGSIVHADEIMIWTDVSGIRTADPKHIPHTQCVPTLNYIEAQELADNGLKLLHHWMLDLPKKHSIPVSIANAFDDQGEKTIICNRNEQSTSSIIISNPLEPSLYKHIFHDQQENMVHISILTRDAMMIQKIYAMASELAMQHLIIIKTYESKSMHHIIAPETCSKVIIHTLHTMIEH